MLSQIGAGARPSLDVASASVAATMSRCEVCVDASDTVVYAILSLVDGLVAAAASVQLLRLYTHNPLAGWTRQKVFHCLILASNFGFALFFVLSLLAECKDWPCWSHACTFILVAIPQIVFLATFLLLLSFWVDLCHQATDPEEDNEDEVDDDDHVQCPNLSPSDGKLLRAERPSWRWCGCFRRLRVRGRQKIVIVALMKVILNATTAAMHTKLPKFMSAVLFMCALTVAFSILIWYGTGNNQIDSGTMAEAYSYFYAIIILLSGGGLAIYGLALYTKMCRLQSGKASADITKVAGLAVVSVVCFSLRASLIFFSDIPVVSKWHAKQGNRVLAAVLTLFYYIIGESIPSVVVLWVMREMPRQSSIKSKTPAANDVLVQSVSETEAEQTFILQQSALEQWIIPAGLPENRVPFSRSYKSNNSTSPVPTEVKGYSRG